MNAQQLHDYIIKPTLEYMGNSYNSVDARFLLLCTAAIESECGHYIKQVNGPALGPWQMEPETHNDIHVNCDALKNNQDLLDKINNFAHKDLQCPLTQSPMYACAMARLKYSMDPQALPKYNGGTNLDLDVFYQYYKRVYNTIHGASTFAKWCDAINRNGILKVEL